MPLHMLGQTFSQKKITLKFSENDFAIKDGHIKVYDYSKNYICSSDTTIPALPYCCVRILIAPNCEYKDLAISKDSLLYNVNTFIRPIEKVASYRNLLKTEHENAEILYKSKYFPENNVIYTGVHSLDGFKYISLLVCPFSYDYEHKKLYLHYQLDISINLMSPSSKAQSIINESTVKHIDGNMYGLVKKLVCNSEELDILYPERKVFKNYYQSRSLQHVEDYPIEYLIVTCDSLKSVFTPLTTWKTTKGIRAKVLTTEYIDSTYTGNRKQIRIKKAINDYYNGNYNGLKYVLLGGDETIIPPQMIYVKSGTEHSTTPTDLYYACLKEYIWPDSANNIFFNDSSSLTPNVFLTRIPVSNTQHVKSFVNRIIDYENLIDTSLWKDTLLMAGKVMSNSYYINDTLKSDAQIFGDTLYYNYIKPNWQGGRKRLYDTYSDCSDSTPYFSKENLQAELSNGYPFVSISTHGNEFGFIMENNQQFNIFDVPYIRNHFYSIITTNACFTNSFDTQINSLSEALIQSNNSNIIGYFGSSREGLYYKYGHELGPSDVYNGNFYRNLFDNSLEKNFGYITTKTKLDLLDFYTQNSSYRWLQHSINPLGDPESSVFVSKPLIYDEVIIDFSRSNPNYFSVLNIDGGTMCVMSSNDFGMSRYEIIDDEYANFYNVEGDMDLCINNNRFIPYRAKINPRCLYFQNEYHRHNIQLFSPTIIIGKEVSQNKTSGKSHIECGTTKMNYVDKLIINDGFIVEKGATLIINKINIYD